jgi:hypothetical protein
MRVSTQRLPSAARRAAAPGGGLLSPRISLRRGSWLSRTRAVVLAGACAPPRAVLCRHVPRCAAHAYIHTIRAHARARATAAVLLAVVTLLRAPPRVGVSDTGSGTPPAAEGVTQGVTTTTTTTTEAPAARPAADTTLPPRVRALGAPARAARVARPVLTPSVSLSALCPRQCASLRAQLAPPAGTPAAAEWSSRSALYASIAADFGAAGFGGVSPAGGTQGMSVAQLFAWDAVTDLPSPRLTRLDVPVRAIVLPLPANSAAAAAMAAAASEALLALCGPAGVWVQDPSAYHLSLFHASHHLQPVPATQAQLAAERHATERVMNATCPMVLLLERVTVTRGGVFIACWNVISGGQPARLRAQLRAALPRAPAAQLLRDPPILHATLARVLRPPRAARGGGTLGPLAARDALADAAAALSQRLCGLRAVVDAAWFVLEFDALALALQGAYAPQRLPLACAQEAGAHADADGGAARAAAAAGAAGKGGRALGGRALDIQR